MHESETFCALSCPPNDAGCLPSYGDSCPKLDLQVLNTTQKAIQVVSVQMFCHKFQNPAYGLSGFDNVGMGFLTIFTSITLEGWVDVMYQLNASWGVQWFNVIYFTLLIMFGSFFLLNLALAVIW